MYVLLIFSLKYYALSNVINQVYQYTCNGTTYGPTFLKVNISTAHVNTKASVSFLREKLSSLDTYTVSIDSNINIFNDYVKTQVHVLTSRGETENYLVINIFKGHRVENCCVFVSYIEEKKDEYDEGGNITWGNPVEKELNKYKEMVQLKICNDPSQEQ